MSLTTPQTRLLAGAVALAAGLAGGVTFAACSSSATPLAAPSATATPAPQPSRATSATATPSPKPSPSPTPATCETLAKAGFEFAYGRRDCFPKIDASTATHPLALAFIKDFTGTETTSEAEGFTKTDQAYHRLIDGEVDLILVTEPSADELAYATQRRVELEVTPVVREAFVFLTNPDNPVDSLTQDQIKGIYSGEITDWSDLGGPAGAIAAYQRPENSGSQTGLLSLVMADTPLAEPPTEMVAGQMGELIEAVAAYNNRGGALGYSYYYYVTAMYGTDAAPAPGRTETKLIAIDGIAPNHQTIAAQEYPYTTAYYSVIRQDEPAGSPARLAQQAMLSAQGQRTAAVAGYVPLVADDAAAGSGSGKTLYGTAPGGNAMTAPDDMWAMTCTELGCDPVLTQAPGSFTLQDVFIEGTDIKAALLEAAGSNSNPWHGEAIGDTSLDWLMKCDLSQYLDAFNLTYLTLEICGTRVSLLQILDRVGIYQRWTEDYQAQDPLAVPYLAFTYVPLTNTSIGVEACLAATEDQFYSCSPYSGLVADNLYLATLTEGLDTAERDAALAAITTWAEGIKATAKADPSHFYIATAHAGRPVLGTPGYDSANQELNLNTQIVKVPRQDRSQALRASGANPIKSYILSEGSTLEEHFSDYTLEIDLQVKATPITLP